MWQVFADKLAREIVRATGGRPIDAYVADPAFIGSVTNLADATRKLIDDNVAAGFSEPDDAGLAEYLVLLADLVRVGRAIGDGSATDEDAAAWNPLIARALLAHGSVSDAQSAPGDAGRVH